MTTQTTATTFHPLHSVLKNLKPLNLPPVLTMTTPPQTPESPPSSTNTATDTTTTADIAKASPCIGCTSLQNCKYPHHCGFSEISTPMGPYLIECPHHRSQKQQQREERLRIAGGIPSKYKRLSFRQYKIHTGNEAAITAFIKATKSNEPLYLWGDKGTGKSRLVCTFANEMLRRGRGVKYITAAEMLMELRYNNEGSEERLRTYQETEILIIEDMGTERATEYNGEQLWMVLEGRQRESRQTIMTSEISKREEGERYERQGFRGVWGQLKGVKAVEMR